MRTAVRLTMALAVIAACAGPSLAGGAPRLTIRRDIELGTVHGRPRVLALDAYVPRTGGPHPGVVWIHGGRWGTGDKEQEEHFASELAEQGFAVFAINYRLAGKGLIGYPDAVEDVQKAVRWVREHAAEFEVDPNRLAAGGNSAGGHLAGLVATLGEGSLDADARVRAAFALSGPMDLEPLLEAKNDNLRTVVEVFLGCARNGCPEVAREASPVTHVDPSDSPMFLVNGTDEVIPLSQSTRMAEALAAAGVSHRLVAVTGDSHGKGNLRSGLVVQNGKTAPELLLAFLGSYLDQPIRPELFQPRGEEAGSTSPPGRDPGGGKGGKGGKGGNAEPPREPSGGTGGLTTPLLVAAAAGIALMAGLALGRRRPRYQRSERWRRTR